MTRRRLPTPAEHAEIAAAVRRMRGRVAGVAATVNRRASAKAIDAVVKLDMRLHLLNVALADVADDAGVSPNPYHPLTLPAAEGEPGPLAPDDAAAIGRRRPPANVAQHRAMGRALAETRDAALTLFVRLANEHFGKTGTVTSKANAVYRLTDTARCRLDDLMARDWPAEFHPHVYYPNAGPPPPAPHAPMGEPTPGLNEHEVVWLEDVLGRKYVREGTRTDCLHPRGDPGIKVNGRLVGYTTLTGAARPSVAGGVRHFTRRVFWVAERDHPNAGAYAEKGSPAEGVIPGSVAPNFASVRPPFEP